MRISDWSSDVCSSDLNLCKKKIAEKRTDALHKRDEDDQQRDGLQQLELGEPAVLLQVGDLAKETRLGVVQPVDEKLEHVAQHRLGGGEKKEAENTQTEKTDEGLHIAEQAEVELQAGRLA